MTSFHKIIKHNIQQEVVIFYIYILSSVLTWHQWGRTEMKHDWGQLNDWLSVMWVLSGTLLKIPKYRYPHMFSQIFHIRIVLIAAVWHGSPELCTLGLIAKRYCHIEHLLISFLIYSSAVFSFTHYFCHVSCAFIGYKLAVYESTAIENYSESSSVCHFCCYFLLYFGNIRINKIR